MNLIFRKVQKAELLHIAHFLRQNFQIVFSKVDNLNLCSRFSA